MKLLARRLLSVEAYENDKGKDGREGLGEAKTPSPVLYFRNLVMVVDEGRSLS